MGQGHRATTGHHAPQLFHRPHRVDEEQGARRAKRVNFAMAMTHFWLVVRNMAFIISYIGNVIIPTDELIFFRGVGIPPTRFSWMMH